MTDVEQQIFSDLNEMGASISSPTWEACRAWLREREWKINVLSDYPKDEVKFTVRKGFERIEVSGSSDLEVMGRAMLEIHRRHGTIPAS